MTVVFYAVNLCVCIDDLFHILLVLMTPLQTNGMYVHMYVCMKGSNFANQVGTYI
jgi:hypothetical protein